MKRKRIRIFRVLAILMITVLAASAVCFASTTIKNSGNYYIDSGSGKIRLSLFSVNGRAAFCVERGKAGPKNGALATPELYKKSDLDKYLYYGFQGPEQWKGFKNNQQARGVTALLVSYEHFKHESFNGVACYKEFKKYISGKSKPSVKLSLSKKSVKTAGLSEAGRLVTEIISVNGSEKGSLRVPIPKGMIFHNADSGKIVKKGEVKLKKGDRFYFEATDSIDSGKLYTVKGYNKKLEVTKFVTKSSSVQDLVQLNLVEDKKSPVELTINWNDHIGLKITKKDENGNPVSGCSFAIVKLAEDGWMVNGDDPTRENIMKENNKLGVVTVDENGVYTDNDLLRMGYLYAICEAKAADGYVLTDKVVIIDADGEEACEEAEFVNKKQSGRIVILKKGEKHQIKDNKMVKSEVPLEGAEFEIRKDGKVIETLITDNEGRAESSELDTGSYTVSETKAPDGYIADTDVRNVEIRMDETKQHMDYNLPFLNKPEETTLTVEKLDKETKERLEGACFSLENESGESLELHTGKDGSVTVNNIPEGEYTIKEKEAPKGYENDAPDQTVVIGGNNSNERSKTCSFYNTRKKDSPKPEVKNVDENPGGVADVPKEEADIPKTGDDSNIALYSALFAMSVGGLALLTLLRRCGKL